MNLRRFQKMQEKLNEKLKTNLFSGNKFEVTSLYTNIPRGLGLKGTKYWLDKCPELIYSRLNKSFILETLKHVLENSHFVLNE